MHYDHRSNESNFNQVLEMHLDQPTFGRAVASAALITAYHLPRPYLRNLGIGHNGICVKVDKMDIKFIMIKCHVTLQPLLVNIG